MREIILTQGFKAQVDDEDYEQVSQFNWNVRKDKYTYYAKRNISINGRQRTLDLHVFILGKNGVLKIDHQDGNGLNCQKNNMRFCTNQQNCMNRRKQKNCSSQYKGVSFHKKIGKFIAYIRDNRLLIHLGYFESEIEAAKAYDIRAKELFGEFAYLNFK